MEVQKRAKNRVLSMSTEKHRNKKSTHFECLSEWWWYVV